MIEAENAEPFVLTHGKGDGAVRFGIKKPKEGKDQEEFSPPQKKWKKRNEKRIPLGGLFQ